jgi:hypothetical protein
MSIEQFSGRPRIFEMGVNRAGCTTFVIHGFANMGINPVHPYQEYKNRLLEIVVDGAELAPEAQCILSFSISDYFRQELVGAPVAERDFDFNLARTECDVKFDGDRKSTVQVRYDFNTAFRKKVYQPDGTLGPDPDGGTEHQIHQIYFQIFVQTNGVEATARLPKSTETMLCTLLRAN